MKPRTALTAVVLGLVLAYACMVAEAAPRLDLRPVYRFWWDRPAVVEVPKGAILYWRADCKAMIMDFAPEKQPAPGWVPVMHCARI